MLKFNRMIRCALPVVAMIGIVGVSFGFAHAPAAETKPVQHPGQKIVNTHLHGAKAVVAEKPANKHVARHWRRRWSFAYWAVLHRGLGNVQGEVHTTDGIAISGVRLALRTPAGKPLRSTAAKHITYSSKAGTFIMLNVRAGNYRVRADHGKANAHVPVHVRPAVASVVFIKM